MSKKTFSSLATVLFCATAIIAGLNSTTVLHYAWRIWYGNHLKWNQMDIHINNSEYFMPMTESGETLYIADLKSKDAFIVLHAEARNRELQKLFVENYCRSGECRQMNQQSYTIDNREVDSFSFVKLNAISKSAMFHQYLVIDGRNSWIEYFGAESAYPAHKATIDALIQKIATPI